jgi:RNA polymerase sigma-70 factor (ECF subfamily)
MADDPRGVVDTVARESYGRLIAYLAARTGDVAAAEDALSEAFVAALRTWPRDGVPLKPHAWLLTAARRRLIDRARHERMRAEAEPSIRQLVREAEAMSEQEFPDERLKLLFVCAHPAIDSGMHTPLMLQVVLGLDAATIASAFLTSPTAMGQRLSRAKARIREARIAFDVPDRHELPPRLEAVLDAIYAAYGSGWDDIAGSDPRRRGLAHEAVWLARTVLQLMPDEPEARGLLALMLYCEARRPARRTVTGDYVPMSEQNTDLWDMTLIDEAERELLAAASLRRVGRFQLEAALQSAHTDGARRGEIDWRGIALLYEGLVGTSPTAGALVGRAAARGEAEGAEHGLAALDAVDPQIARSYQPYWAVRAHLLRRAGTTRQALEAYDRAIGLTEDSSTRHFLLRRRAELHAEVKWGTVEEPRRDRSNRA